MNSSPSTERFERKFYISQNDEYLVDINIKLHPALFHTLHHERRVNNIYFDSIDLGHYESHLAGVAARSKIRVRWYGDTFGTVAHPVLEIKMKNGEVGMKKSFHLTSFSVENCIKQSTLQSLVSKSSLSPYWRALLQDLRPVLLNSYVRTYWISADGEVRLTVDRDWTSYSVSTTSFLRSIPPVTHDGVILEMKYLTRDQKRAAAIASNWPWRLTRNSKYVVGMEKLISQ